MAKVACFALAVALTLTGGLAHFETDCQEGWSSCDASLWVSPKYNPQDPLSSYTPGEIRGPLEYEIKFSCRGRRNGYYADLDHSCKVWHYCNTTREINPYNGLATWTYTHFSYACLEEGTRYDQVAKECVPEARSNVRCRDSEYYYPTGDYVYDVPVATNNRLVPVRCPTSVSDVKCSIQKDHINLAGCPESPGFYESFADLLPSSVDGADVTTLPSVLLYNGPADSVAVPSVVAEVPEVPEKPIAVPVTVPVAPRPSLYHHEPVPVAPRPRLDLTGRKTLQPSKNVYAPAGGRKIASPASAGRKSIVNSYSNQYVDGEQLIFPRRLSQPLVVPTIATAAAAAVTLRDVAFQPVPVAPSNSSESAEADFLGLPVGSTKILGDKIDTSFDCSGRSYGYYADVKNQCKVYHVCSPKTDEFGVRFYEHFSFVCAEGLIFDQRKITCVPAREASHQCTDSERYFEKTSEQFHKEHESFIANRKVVTTEAPAVTPDAAPVTGRTLTILRVKSIEPELDSSKQYSKVNAPVAPVAPVAPLAPAAPKSLGPPRVFLKEPTVPTRVQADEYDHDTEEVALRGDQSPVAREEQVNEPAVVPVVSPSPPPVKRPPAVTSYRPVNYGTKVAYPSKRVNHSPSRPAVHSTVKKYYVSSLPRAPAAPKRVVYRLKKGNRAPASYSGAVAPYLGGSHLSHNPRISQAIGSSYPVSAPRRIHHSPSISQAVGAPSVPAAPQDISHNPSITQYIGQPAAVAAPPERLSHNPSVSQYIAAPASSPVAPQTISHSPSIVQYVGAPGAPAPAAPASISHSPLISQYVPDLANTGYPASSQTISHNPSIHQVIVRSDSSRPSSRLVTW